LPRKFIHGNYRVIQLNTNELNGTIKLKSLGEFLLKIMDDSPVYGIFTIPHGRNRKKPWSCSFARGPKINLTKTQSGTGVGKALRCLLSFPLGEMALRHIMQPIAPESQLSDLGVRIDGKE